MNIVTQKNCVAEFGIGGTSNRIPPSCAITDPLGVRRVVPAYDAGDGEWRLRYSSPHLGTHVVHLIDQSGPNVRRVATDNGRIGAIEVIPYEGSNHLLQHGAISASPNDHVFRHSDGEPFLWLADTWWLGFCDRLSWPEDFQNLTADRVKKGFSVVQIVAGFYPELDTWDSQARSVSGYAWETDFQRINSDFFDEADLRIQWLVGAGIVPCIVGSWGYHLFNTGPDVMKEHWRNIIARWAAYPVAWCLAGETRLPYYPEILSTGAPEVSKQLAAQWAEIGRFVRSNDPFQRPVTSHPSPGDGSLSSSDIWEGDRSLIDFVMLQTGHEGAQTLPIALSTLKKELSVHPRLPVLNGEACYEGMMGASWSDIQRYLFWSNMLQGAAGFSYGSQGLWNMNAGEWSGLAGDWGGGTWREAAARPGSHHVGLGGKILRDYEWWKFEPHPEWIEGDSLQEGSTIAFSAGIPGKMRMIYFPPIAYYRMGATRTIRINLLELGDWKIRFINPRTAESIGKRAIQVGPSGIFEISGGLVTANPSMEDWLLVMERIGIEA